MPGQHDKVAAGLRRYILHIVEQMKKARQSAAVVAALNDAGVALQRLPAAPAVEELKRCTTTLRALSEESSDRELRHLVGDCVVRLDTFLQETLG